MSRAGESRLSEANRYRSYRAGAIPPLGGSFRPSYEGNDEGAPGETANQS